MTLSPTPDFEAVKARLEGVLARVANNQTFSLALSKSYFTGKDTVISDLRAALTHVDALTSRVERLRAALKPFAEAADELEDETRDGSEIWELPAAMSITAGHLHQARAAYDDTSLESAPKPT